jgi:hypothetical protein
MYLGLRLVARPLMLAVTLSVGAAFFANVEQAQAVVGPSASSPYTLGTFKGVAPSGATQPDDIAVSADGADLWVGYGNGADPTGATGSGNLVEYNIATGAVMQNITIPGHIDGLKVNPANGEVWATQNEDGNPTLTIVNPKNGKFETSPVIKSSLLTGGLDDLVFSGKDSAFVTASSQVDTTTPAIVEISLKGKKKKGSITVTSVLPGAPATVFNVVTNKAETGDMIGDPDSMTIDPAGELVLDNRSDDSLYIVRNSSATNPVLRVPLTLVTTPGVAVEVDDTIFTYSLSSGESSTAGTIFITDTTANIIYTLTKPYFPTTEVYSATVTTGEEGVGLVDLNTGVVVPVATGFMGVHGLAFSPTPIAIP